MDAMNELNSVLEAKLALLKSYELLTEQIQETFRKEDLEGVKTLLSRREEIARKIDKLDSSLRERMFAWENEKPETATKFRGMVDGFHRKIGNVFERIALKEKDLIPVMRGESERLKKELMRIRGIRHAATTYYEPGPSSPRFVDARK
jgi:hypothetical protein